MKNMHMNDFLYFRSVSYQCLHFPDCAHQRGSARDRLGKMYSIYTNKDCLAFSARKLSASIQLGLSQADTGLKAAEDAAILSVSCRSPLQSYPQFIVTVLRLYHKEHIFYPG